MPVKTTMDKGKYKATSKQHGYCQPDIAFPEGQYPVVYLDRGRYGNDQSGKREEEAEVWVHA